VGPKLSFAIVFAIILIGGASWNRFFAPKTITNTLTLQPTNNGVVYSDEDLLRGFLYPNKELNGTSETASTEQEENLTNTDIISRNLVLSYIGLTANGTVDPSSFDTLIEQYVDQTVGLHVFEPATLFDIKVVQDSNSNAINYANGFSNIYQDFAQRASVIANNIDSSAAGESYKLIAESMVTIYEGLASAFRDLPVPTSLAQLHLELINKHLSNAQAMRAGINLDTDPITAISGLIAIRENSIRETAILEEIKKILEDKWGIIYTK
jgi:hypothetical protein